MTTPHKSSREYALLRAQEARAKLEESEMALWADCTEILHELCARGLVLSEHPGVSATTLELTSKLAAAKFVASDAFYEAGGRL